MPTLTLPLRHCKQATAIACRLLFESGAERCCPGSSVAGAIGCQRSVGSIGGPYIVAPVVRPLTTCDGLDELSFRRPVLSWVR
jgi:hypothetical protein